MICNDTYTQHDIDAINQYVLKDKFNKVIREIPADASYCVYGNANRTAINAHCYKCWHFCKYLKNHWKISIQAITNAHGCNKSRKYETCDEKQKNASMEAQDMQYIYKHCGDYRVQTKVYGKDSHFVNPLLKLYYHIPLMLVSNDDVLILCKWYSSTLGSWLLYSRTIKLLKLSTLMA